MMASQVSSIVGADGEVSNRSGPCCDPGFFGGPIAVATGDRPTSIESTLGQAQSGPRRSCDRSASGASEILFKFRCGAFAVLRLPIGVIGTVIGVNGVREACTRQGATERREILGGEGRSLFVVANE